jgi:hypothetical protein
VTEQRLVARMRLADARDRFLGDDEDVRGRLRFDVVEGEHEVVFIDDLRRDLTGDEFLEEGHGRDE